MKNRSALVCMLSIVFASTSHAGPRLSAALVSDAKSGSSSVMLVIENSGDAPAFILTRSLPFVGRGGVLVDAPLEVKSLSGAEASFSGPMTDRVAEDVPATERLDAGSKKILAMDVAKSYELSPSTVYSVRLQSDLYYMSQEEAALVMARRLSGNRRWREVKVDSTWARVSLPETAFRSAPTSTDTPVACIDEVDQHGNPLAPSKQTVFLEALAAATSDAKAALVQLQSMTTFDVVSSTEAWFRFIPSTNYTRYFGQHGPDVNIGAGEQPAPDDMAVDAQLFALGWRMAGDGFTAKPPVTLSCRCNSDEVPSNTIAYVQRSGLYVVHVCPVFFSLPLRPVEDIGSSSRAGTLVHEFTHFNDTIAPDLVHLPVEGKDISSVAYALEIAVSDRSKAVRFPNSYKFFVLGQVHGLDP